MIVFLWKSWILLLSQYIFQSTNHKSTDTKSLEVETSRAAVLLGEVCHAEIQPGPLTWTGKLWQCCHLLFGVGCFRAQTGLRTIMKHVYSTFRNLVILLWMAACPLARFVTKAAPFTKVNINYQIKQRKLLLALCLISSVVGNLCRQIQQPCLFPNTGGVFRDRLLKDSS